MQTIKKISLFFILNFINAILLTKDTPIESTKTHTFLYSKHDSRSFLNIMKMEGLTQQTLSLQDIQKEILEHTYKRQVSNFVFVNTMIHIATLQAIEVYLNFDQQKQESYHASMQSILDSHAYFLYSPIYWRTIRHVRLVDNFIYLGEGKRFKLSPIDSVCRFLLFAYASGLRIRTK